MVNKKDADKKKGKGILLKLKLEPRQQLYNLAKKEKRTVTSLIEEAIDNYMKNKNVKLDNGFDEFMGSKTNAGLFGEANNNDVGLFGGASNKKDDFDIEKELNIL